MPFSEVLASTDGSHAKSLIPMVKDLNALDCMYRQQNHVSAKKARAKCRLYVDARGDDEWEERGGVRFPWYGSGESGSVAASW